MSSTSLQEVKISVSELEVGMYVSRLDKDWLESSFMFQGFLIENQKQIIQLQKECNDVYIDVVKSDETQITKIRTAAKASTKNKQTNQKSGFFDKLFSGSKKTIKEKKPDVKRHTTNKLEDIIEHKISTKSIKPPKVMASFDQEIDEAKETHTKTSQTMKEAIKNVKEGKDLDINASKDSIHDCMESILRSPDAMMLMTNLKTRDKTAWQQSMNAAVLTILFGRYLNLSDHQLETLGLCGMLFDIGKMKISKEDIEKAEDKTELIQSHTRLGYEILSKCPGELGKTVAEVAYNHHELLDGSGYPRGLSGKQISPYTRMISIIDTYNTLTIDKPGKKGRTHYDAMTMLLSKAGRYFDETLVNSFNQCIGTYPVGTIVEMNTGEIAMVVEANPEQKLRPKIMLLTNSVKEKCSKKVINLAEKATTKDGKPYSIRGIVLAETYGITL